MYIGNLIRKHLTNQHMMQLATISGDQPWCCTVYFVADDKLNIYWASLPSRRHSQEIAKNNKVAAAIAVKFVNGEKVVGLQAEGDAWMVDEPAEIKPIANLYADKFGRNQVWVDDFVNQNTEHRLYMLKPRLLVLFDEVNFPQNTRLEWKP